MVNLLNILSQLHFLSLPNIARLCFAIRRHGVNLILLFSLTEKTCGHKPALVDSRGTFSYEELQQRCENLAHQLAEKYGIRKGHKVAFFCRNHASFVQGIIAVSRIGAHIYLLNCSISQRQFDRLVQEHHFDFLIYDEAFRELIEISSYQHAKLVTYHDTHESINSLSKSVPHRKEKLTASSSGKIVLLTGGTTGKPKQVIHRPSLFNFLNPFAALLNRLQLSTYKTAYIATPIYHGYGIAILLSFLALGKKVVIQESFAAKSACALIRQHQVEVVTVVPLMVHKMLKHDREALASLACIASGGAKLNPVLVREVTKHLGNVLYNLYGTSEAGLNIIATPEDLNHHPDTLGKGIPGSQLQVVVDGKEVEPGRIGQFCIRNEWSMTNSPNLWIQTGDIGYRDENGYYFLCGRNDDLIISAGNNIYPSEIEATLCEHPSIEDVAVIGVEDAYAGHMLKAYVQLYADEKMTEDALLSWLRQRVATYQLPREVAFVEELPYTPVGKLDRKQVQSMTRIKG